MVPPYSHRVSRVRRYSGYRWLKILFAYRILTFFDWPSHVIRLKIFNTVFCPNPESITTLGLASSAFARHYWRNLCWFLFLALLRCFSSGGSPHIPIDSVYDDKTFLLPDCSIRKSTDITTAFTIGSEILWFFVILKIGCFYNLFYPFRNCSIFTFVNIYHFNWGLSLTVDKQYFSLYLLSLFSFQGTCDKMSGLVALRCSVNNSHSSNLFRCFGQLHSLVLVSRYSRAPRLGFSYLVGLSGLEPPTSRLSGGRSNRLSYKPMLVILCWVN